jgi:hypothetical protein
VERNGRILVVTGPSRSSAAVERFQGLKATLRPDIQVFDTEAGDWSEAEGALAFNAWYGVFKSRQEVIHAIVGQSDDLAVGAKRAAMAVPKPEHARMFGEAKCFGVGAVPGFGKEKVDDGRSTRASSRLRTPGWPSSCSTATGSRTPLAAAFVQRCRALSPVERWLVAVLPVAGQAAPSIPSCTRRTCCRTVSSPAARAGSCSCSQS